MKLNRPALAVGTIICLLGIAALAYFYSNNQAHLRAAVVELMRNDPEIQKMLTPPAPAPRPMAPGSITDQAQIEEIIHSYLLLHPQVLQEAIAELEKIEATAAAAKYATAVKDNAAALYNSPYQVVLGNPQGDVTFVEFFDYNCGYCKRAYDDMINLMKADPKLKVVLKEFPVLGPGSVEAAQVAVAVRMQDKSGKKYLEFHQKLLLGRGQADKARALAVAKDIGLDMARLEKDMASEEAKASIEESLKLAESLGLNGTPSYVVGPNVVVGAIGLPGLKEKVNTARCGKATC
jgi:protein-disulfide isomerase